MHFDICQTIHQFGSSRNILSLHHPVLIFSDVRFDEPSLLMQLGFVRRQDFVKPFFDFPSLLFIEEDAIGFLQYLIHFRDSVIISIISDFLILQILVYPIVCQRMRESTSRCQLIQISRLQLAKVILVECSFHKENTICFPLLQQTICCCVLIIKITFLQCLVHTC